MNRGFSMIELMFVIAVLAFIIAGLLVAYVNCLALNEHNLKFANAMNLARQLMENYYYRRGDWNYIINRAYNEVTVRSSYNLQGYSASIFVNEIDPLLREIAVVVCWRSRGGRITGEDLDLDGLLDSGEDRNGDNRLSSPCEITSALTKR